MSVYAGVALTMCTFVRAARWYYRRASIKRYIVKRNGEPAVLILSVSDYVKTFAPPPNWLEKSWDSAKRHGLDKLTMKDIDSEIAASRGERRARKAKSGQ